MKRKHILTSIIILALGYFLFGIAKGVNMYINKFDSLFEKSAQIQNIKLINDSIKLYDFKLDKDTVVLFKNNSKTKIIHFWATWCKPCIEDFNQLTDFYIKNRDSIELLVISEEKIETINEFLKNNQYNLPFYKLKKENYFFSVDSLPLPFNCIIIKGKIKGTFIGKYNWKNYNNIK